VRWRMADARRPDGAGPDLIPWRLAGSVGSVLPLTLIPNRTMRSHGPIGFNPEDKMNASRNRREFLADVGRGMLVASVGYGMAENCASLPPSPPHPETLEFGSLEPLVRFMQETPADNWFPASRQTQIRDDLRRLVAAAALATPALWRRRLRRLSHDDGAVSGPAHGA